MAVLAFDTFQRSDENPLNPTNWSVFSAGLQIVSHECEATSTAAASGSIWAGPSPVSWPNDQWSEITVHANNNVNSNYWVIVREGTSGYLLVIPGAVGNTVVATLYTLSPFSSFSSFNITVLIDSVVKLQVQGSTIKTYVDGVLVHTDSDSSVASGRPGLVENTNGQATTDIQISRWRGGDLNAPNPTSINPAKGGLGLTFPVTVTGTEFDADGGATLSFSGSGITVNSYSVQNATTITASISISGVAALGPRNVIVTNASDGQIGTLVNGFKIGGGAQAQIYIM